MDLPAEVSVEIAYTTHRRAVWRFWLRSYRLSIILNIVVLAICGWLGWRGSWFAFVFLGIAILVTHGRFFYVNLIAARPKTDKFHFLLSSSGIAITADDTTNEFSWRRFSTIWPYEDMWLLILGKHSYLLLPTSGVREDCLEFVRLSVEAGKTGGTCESCGYDVRGQTATTCPECGAKLSEALLRVAKSREMVTTADKGGIRIHAEITEEQLRQAYRRIWWSGWLSHVVAYGIAAGILYAYAWWNDEEPHWRIYAFVVFFLTVYHIVDYHRPLRLVVSHFRRMDNGRHTYSLREDGLSVQNDLGRTDIDWKNVSRLDRYHDMWLLHVGKNFFLLPTSSLNAEAQALIESHVQTGRRD